MADAARRWLMEQTTADERFDLGVELSKAMMEAVVERARISADLPPEERTRLAFRALREAGA